jgi:hypothetical protein
MGAIRVGIVSDGASIADDAGSDGFARGAVFRGAWKGRESQALRG